MHLRMQAPWTIVVLQVRLPVKQTLRWNQPAENWLRSLEDPCLLVEGVVGWGGEKEVWCSRGRSVAAVCLSEGLGSPRQELWRGAPRWGQGAKSSSSRQEQLWDVHCPREGGLTSRKHSLQMGVAPGDGLWCRAEEDTAPSCWKGESFSPRGDPGGTLQHPLTAGGFRSSRISLTLQALATQSSVQPHWTPICELQGSTCKDELDHAQLCQIHNCTAGLWVHDPSICRDFALSGVSKPAGQRMVTFLTTAWCGARKTATAFNKWSGMTNKSPSHGTGFLIKHIIVSEHSHF